MITFSSLEPFALSSLLLAAVLGKLGKSYFSSAHYLCHLYIFFNFSVYSTKNKGL